MSLIPDPICEARACACFCGLPPGHDNPHVCADTVHCNGSWTGEWRPEDPNPPADFKVIRFPSIGASIGRLPFMIGGLFGGFDD